MQAIQKPKNVAQIITLLLGVFWLIDGILQLQPAMFTNVFVDTVLAPNIQNQPQIIASIVAFGVHAFGFNVFWFNLASALIQLLIGALLVFPLRDNFRRFGLWLSIPWALIVWIFGEGFGLLATGSATFYTGAPGAALLYLILAVFLLFSGKKPERLKKLPFVVGIIFLLGAVLNALPMFWQPTMLSMLASVPAVSGWLGIFGAEGTMIGNLLAIDALICLGILLILIPNRPVAWTTIGFLLAVWWIGQNFGGIQTFPFGTATDLNAAPLLILFLIPAVYGYSN